MRGQRPDGAQLPALVLNGILPHMRGAAPQQALIVPPALEIARQCRLDGVQVLRLEAHHFLAALPEVIDIETNEQRIALAQTVKLGDNIDARPQCLYGKTHLEENAGDARAVERVEFKGTGESCPALAELREP